MAVKTIVVAPKKGQRKPLVICEFEEVAPAAPSAAHFNLGDREMGKVAERMTKSLSSRSTLR